MEHIRETATTWPFLYYQRIFVKGYVALAVPCVMAMTSELATGYIYIRRYTQGLQIRDLNNEFQISSAGGGPIGVRRDPLRGVPTAISCHVEVRGRTEGFYWLYTKDDLPRIVNSETHTEFLACVPVKRPNDPPVGNFELVRSFFSRFVDWYRIVTGDVSIVGPDHWKSHLPMYSEELVDITSFSERPIDEIVAEVNPERLTPQIFHWDVDPAEVGTVNDAAGGISNEQRIAHYLAAGQILPEVHRRIGDIVQLVQETKDWALAALAMFPVFEQYFDAFLNEVGARNASFNAWLGARRGKNRVVFIGEKIGWLPEALTAMGFNPASVAPYLQDLKRANEERVQVVHYNKRPTMDESRDFAGKVTRAVILCETVLGNPSPYIVPIERL
jgi:hypothetical protein